MRARVGDKLFPESHKLPLDRRIRLSRIRVLVADRDPRTASLVRRVLYNFGFRLTDVARDGQQAIDMLSLAHYDLLITEYDLDYVDGPELVRRIRKWTKDKTIARDLPIIMLTARAELPNVEISRDSGINEFVRKPFTAKTLSQRIIQVIDRPRDFVASEDYAGPCRRRREPLPEGVEDRRGKRLVADHHRVVEKSDDEIREQKAAIFAANRTIRELLGENVSAAHIISEAVVAEAQDTLQESEGEFIEWARDDIIRLEEAYQDLLGRPGDHTAHQLLLGAAYAIKSQAGTFGYNLGTKIAGMLVDYMHRHQDLDMASLVVVRKHIDTINIIFTQHIKEAEAEMSRDFIDSLKALTYKLG
jgi:two-component system chemotaxis response regulator CheY